MKKRSLIPQTKVKNPEPKEKDDNWVIWAAWADRITFEEIREKTGKTESDVIKLMRKTLRPGSFSICRLKRYRLSASDTSIMPWTFCNIAFHSFQNFVMSPRYLQA